MSKNRVIKIVFKFIFTIILIYLSVYFNFIKDDWELDIKDVIVKIIVILFCINIFYWGIIWPLLNPDDEN